MSLMLKLRDVPTASQESVQRTKYSEYATGWKTRSSNADRSKRLFFSPKSPDRLCGPPILLFGGHRSSFLRVKWPGPEVDHSSPSSAEVKNGWSYTSSPPVGIHGAD